MDNDNEYCDQVYLIVYKSVPNPFNAIKTRIAAVASEEAVFQFLVDVDKQTEIQAIYTFNTKGTKIQYDVIFKQGKLMLEPIIMDKTWDHMQGGD